MYEARDQWMARSIERAAGRNSREPRRVVAWLHNDHARFGEWEAGGTLVRLAGQFLRERVGREVFSIGLMAGAGTFADNFRQVRAVAPFDTVGLEAVFRQAGHPIGWLNLNQPGERQVSVWANIDQTYSRGSMRLRLRPTREFDALVYFDSVSPATDTR